MSGQTPWLRVVGGGCFVNVAVTGILVGMFSAVSDLTLDSILIPFMIGATASFGLSLYLLRETAERPSQGGGDASLRLGQLPVWRKVILAGLGVVFGSMAAVLGIAGLILLSGM